MNEALEFRSYQGIESEQLALEELSRQWARDDFWPVKEFYISLKIPGTFLVYLREGSSWQGLALGREMGGVVELFYIFVSPQRRGQRLGEQLLKYFEQTASTLFRVDKFYLEVRPSNQAAWKLYEKLGYSCVGKRARYYPDGEEALIYERTWEQQR
jgi:ribosomal protein S18 acetylase RimI-like enzyme